MSGVSLPVVKIGTILSNSLIFLTSIGCSTPVGKHLLDGEVFDVGDVVGVRLGHRALRHRVGVERGHLQGEAEVLLHLLGDGVEVRHAGAELAQRDVLDVLRPDGREPGDRAGAERGAGDAGARSSASGGGEIAASCHGRICGHASAPCLVGRGDDGMGVARPTSPGERRLADAERMAVEDCVRQMRHDARTPRSVSSVTWTRAP